MNTASLARVFRFFALAVSVVFLAARPALGALSQTFFVPLPEDQLRTSFQAVYSSTGNKIDSSISIAPIQGNLIIYYDQWEDGYEADLEAPVQATTQIWGDNNPANGIPPGFATDVLTASSVITLRNLIDVPRSAAVVRFDGRDKIGATKPVAVTRFAWATTPGSVLSCSAQISSTSDFGTEFEIPVGENTANFAFNQMFEHVSMFVMAAQDGTTVQIDKDANGSFETSVVLNQGQSYHVPGGVLLGATATASLPVQVHICTGDVGATYESRWLSVYPKNNWTSRYYTPVSTSSLADPAATFLYNPGAVGILVNFETLGGLGSIAVPAKTLVRYEMPSNTGATFYTTGAAPPAFYAFGAMDTDQIGSGNTAYEWAFSLVPETHLTPALKVGSAPGAGDQPISGNGSPIWVVAVAATRLYVDYDGDPATGSKTDPLGNRYDMHFDVTRLQSTRVFDPVDKDQTGMRIYTLDGTQITGAWGEDPASAQAGNPYLDLGYTILPEPQFYASKTARFIADPANNGVADVGDQIEYTIAVTNQGIFPVDGIVVSDLLPAVLTYVPGTTTADGVPLADNVVPPAATAFPIDEAGYGIGILNPAQTKVIKFAAQVAAMPPAGAPIVNTATVSVGISNVPVSSSVPTQPPPCSTITLLTNPNPLLFGYVGALYGADLVATGGTAPYTFTVNGGALPPGVTMSSGGQISGIPTAIGNYYFDVLATDATGCTSALTGTVVTVNAGNLRVGNLVFQDLNGNARADPGEGVDGVLLELFTFGSNPATTIPVTSAFTSSGGFYEFGGVTPGDYFAYVPPGQFQPGGPLSGMMSLPGVQVGDDNAGEDGVDDSNPALNGIRTGKFSIKSGSAPVAAEESGLAGDSDDADDDIVDLTIDFGFYSFGIGNLVFVDTNANGRADPGEGVNNVVVKVFTQGSDPLTATPLDTTLTANGGRYLFSHLSSGNYFVFIPPAEFQSGGDLYKTVSLPGTSVGDDNTGEDGVDSLTPATTGIRSIVFTVGPGLAPTGSQESGIGGTDDDGNDSNINLTIDLGFHHLVGVGNLVFIDVNENGRADAGEGVDGVTVKLFAPGINPLTGAPLATTTTSSGGLYRFSDLIPGSYFVYVPPSQFQPGGALLGTASVQGTAAGDDNTGEDGIDNAAPRTNGISTATIVLTPGLEPTGAAEPGKNGTDDDADDVNVDMTQDFGFYRFVSIGNMVFIDANGNGHYDSGEGVNGVTVQLYSSAQTPGVSTPLDTQVTSGGGRYLFERLHPGTYRVHVPAAMFASGAPLYSTISVDEGLSGDDDVGENGINSLSPAATGISSGLVTLALGQAPTDLNGESGFDKASDNDYDAAIDLTIDFGFANPLGVGNVVFVDANSNGHYDAGEGIADVTVDLYRAGDTPGVASPVASQVTDANGHYLFDYLMAGGYFVHIPAFEFTPGSALQGKVSMTGAGTGSADDSVDENGLDDLTPNLNGIRSITFTLANNAAPTNATTENGYLASEDVRDDNNYDLTIDLGFRVPDPNAVGVGNTVFLDANGNDLFDNGEGVNGVTVKLFAAGADPATANPIATTTTSGDGDYLFSSLAAGSYFIQIPPAMFTPGAPMHRMISIPGQGGDNGIDDNEDENGDDPVAPATSGVRSTVFTLQPNTEPTGNTSEFGRKAYADDIDDDNTDLTIDFGFYRPVGVGNLVYVDTNRNGLFNPGEGVDGVRVELYQDTQTPGYEPLIGYTYTSGGGFYLFSGLKPADYFVHIATVNFAPGGALAGFTPMSGQGADNGADDDLDENGSDPAQPAIDGVSSLTFTLAVGAEPTGQTTEHGAGSTMDDAMDSDVDLTVDFGFYAGVPTSFAQWQAQNPLGGQNGPALDPEGDGLSNLAEYIFGLSPSTGVLPWCPFEIALNPTTNQVDALVRKVQMPGDIVITLQGLSDLAASPGGWFEITSITPEVTGNTGGIETLAYRNLELVNAFTGGKGFVRLLLSLDANHDGTPEATATTEVWGWSRRSLQPQIVTYSNPFSKCAVFTGAVGSVSGNSLNVAAAVGNQAIAGAMTGEIPWYIEVISGDNEGHRFEVDELNSTATAIVIETPHALNTLATIPASLAGDRIALRPHWTLAEWFPPALFRATNNSSTADRLGFYTGTTFAYTWLFSNSGNPKWVNDATLANRGTRVMDPAEALLIQPRSTSAPVFMNLGVVRASKFACPIKQGTRLIGGGWPMDQSFTSRNMLYANGFTGGTSSSRADRIQIWTGDATPGGAAYDSHYLLKTTTLQQWVRVGDAALVNENNLSLFKFMRGVYFNSIAGKPDYIAPVPWTP